MDKVDRKNILLATGIYPPDIGGPATYVSVLQKELPKFGFNMKVLTYGDGEKKDDVYQVSRRQNIVFRYFKYFLEIWKLGKWVDVVYVFDQVSTGIPGAMFKVFNPSKKLVLRIGGDFLWEKAYNNSWTEKSLSDYYKNEKSFIEKVYLKIYNFVFSKSDLIIFTTDWQKNIYLRHFNIEDTKCFVVNNPFPSVGSRQMNSSFFKKELLFAGRLIKLKNLDNLIDAVANVDDIKLTIIGEGPLREDLESKIKQNNLENVISLFSALSHNELLDKINESSIVVAPAISEVSPNIVLESIKLEKPVIVTKECGFFQKYSKDLVFFNPFDVTELKSKIEYLLNEKHYNSYMEKISKIDSNRSWSDVSKEHAEILKNIL